MCSRLQPTGCSQSKVPKAAAHRSCDDFPGFAPATGDQKSHQLCLSNRHNCMVRGQGKANEMVPGQGRIPVDRLLLVARRSIDDFPAGLPQLPQAFDTSSTPRALQPPRSSPPRITRRRVSAHRHCHSGMRH